MKNISNIEFFTGSKEERLPGYTAEFPYIASRAELDKYAGRFVPWHWHKTVELFYMESGSLEYYTPQGKTVFPPGSGGMVNSGVLHMTKARGDCEENIQLIHIFDPSFIAGGPESRIERQYVAPLLHAPCLEIIPLFPGIPREAKILKAIRASFDLLEEDFGYELKLRGVLSDLWLRFFALSRPLLDKKGEYDKTNDKVKMMMVYVHEHYADKILISDLAAAAFCSQRECFRVFHDCLRTTPVEYMKSYRLQIACKMLEEGREPVTSIGYACGLGSSSYFGKVFREQIGCTPAEYRRRWRDHDNKRRK